MWRATAAGVRAGGRGLACSARLRHANAHQPAGTVYGCGSNVVDNFFKLRALPKPGEKGFFASPTTILEQSIVGGVTLNHLSWAAALGVPTGLMALQGDDPSGKLIRAKMKELNVSTEYIEVKKEYTTAESYVLLQPDGERSIIMASGGTSLINKEVVDATFAAAIASASFVTTEISQVPLSGVLELLALARKNGKLSVLDVDVSPSVAVNEAHLGSFDEVKQCALAADILKPAKHAAVELLQSFSSDLDVASMSTADIASTLCKKTNSKLVALTGGSEGCVLATPTETVSVPPFQIPRVEDATGAGDAFLGGLIVAMYNFGIPSDANALRRAGLLANATGAANCEILGALPTPAGRNRVIELLQSADPELVSILGHSTGAAGHSVSVAAPLTAFFASLEADRATLTQSAALLSSQHELAEQFVTTLQACTGRVFTTGVGKSGAVARRMAVSLTSTGTPAQFVHTTEWLHGDLGGVREGDCVVVFSHSGETLECLQVAPLITQRGATLLSIVGKKGSTLGGLASAHLQYDAKPEPAGGVPSTSVVAQEAVVNAVHMELIARQGFTATDFAANHPGGAIGAALSGK